MTGSVRLPSWPEVALVSMGEARLGQVGLADWVQRKLAT